MNVQLSLYSFKSLIINDYPLKLQCAHNCKISQNSIADVPLGGTSTYCIERFNPILYPSSLAYRRDLSLYLYGILIGALH